MLSFSQNYDASELTTQAARSFVEYIISIQGKSRTNTTKLLAKANELAKYAISEDDNLLAFAIAGPAVSIAIVQFRDKIIVNDTNTSSYLKMYWRGLSSAWHQSNKTEIWGAPFRDCGPLQGRWLWPYSVKIQEGPLKVVATSFIAADVDQCNDALEAIFGRKHRLVRVF